MAKNEFKKVGAEGNKLPEQIGKGIDVEHLKKVMAERGVAAINTFKSSYIDKLKFEKACDKIGLNKSLVMRELMKDFTKNNS